MPLLFLFPMAYNAGKEECPMLKRKLPTMIALALTGLFFLLSPLIQKNSVPPPRTLSILRVWLREDEPAVGRWLKKQAQRYEKETGERIYLRNASEKEMAEARQAQSGQPEIIIPDLMVMQGLSSPLLFRGYALIVRDDRAALLTPSPTSLLFQRPTASPGPSPLPEIQPDFSAPGAILTPAFLSPGLPGCIPSDDPLAAFSAGKAPAALLTAGQAATLSFGYRVYALEEGAGMMAVSAQSMNEKGGRFLSFLLSAESQRSLSQYGLYSCLPSLRLYDAADPIRALIESSKTE